ncbi:carboxymuconolactone decarboxylase family protein [Spirosoma linguale]|uniref:Alkylhydroperoxidase like protein, AhpD family n=1 Tax=Spirosoma linguale (strain ATCC 33905 / DSM 74 / LMG 10896 / Claus 1) TaxID=504472 RepID=D2QKR0_SPILD|nr:alkylhydroperoxidase like protein, AhpD family [Spirosoma linguale DSM 74]
MATFTVPTRDQVSAQNQQLFDNLQKGLGFVPNLYATFGLSDNGLGAYLAFQQSQTKGAFKAKEREAINLVVSQANNCVYCLAAHTALGKMNGFSDEQILQLRAGHADFDPKLDALVKLAKAITETKGHPATDLVDAYIEAGYAKSSVVDLILMVGDKIISNYLHSLTQIPVDFPAAPVLETAEA